jgi:aryl carrier-like protein
MWRELLVIERIGVNEDIFDLGAHSLLAMRAVVRMRDELAVDVPLRSLFEHPTIAGMAHLIDHLQATAGGMPPGARPGREEILL